MEEKIKLSYKDINFKVSLISRKCSGETILFVHGLGCSKNSFKDVWRFPEFKKYTILTFDLLGFGNSSKPKDFSYSIDEHAEICKLIIERLNLKRIHLVGHSMGGAICLLLIEKMPSRIISFINLEGNLIGDDCTFSRDAVKYSLEDFEKRVFQNFKFNIKNTKNSTSSTSLSNKLFYRWLSKSDTYAFYKTSESLVKWSDSRKLLKMFIDLKIKKCYMFGEKNKDLPVMKLLNNIPKIQISKSGHFMMIDNPKEFYQKLAEFLQR